MTRAELSRLVAGVVAFLAVAVLRADDARWFQFALIAVAVVCSLHAARDPYPVRARKAG
jgi:hypothetical protein